MSMQTKFIVFFTFNQLFLIQEISVEYEARKSKYDQINAGFEGNRSTLEQVFEYLKLSYLNL